MNKKKYADVFLFESYAKEARLIVSLLGKKPYQIEVLDFGMGWGYRCVMAKAFGYNVKPKLRDLMRSRKGLKPGVASPIVCEFK